MPFGFAAIGAAGSLGGALIGSNAAKEAANAQVQAAQIASGTELSMFDTTQGNLQPYIGAGTNALTQLQKLYGIGPGGAGPGSPVLSALGIGPGGQPGTATTPFQQSPGYQFAVNQGTNAVTNAAAGKGGLGGNTLKALTSFGTGVANQDYYNYLSQLSAAWGGLTSGIGGIAGQGANAAANLGGFSGTTAGQIGSNTIGAGNAAASGIIGSANALTGGINGAINSGLQAYGLYNSPYFQQPGGGAAAATGPVNPASLTPGFDPFAGNTMGN